MFYETILWLTIFVVTLIVMLAGMFFLVVKISRFSFIKKVTRENSKLGKLLSTFILLICIVLMAFILGRVNSIVIVIGLMLFWLIADFIVWIANKITKGKINNTEKIAVYAAFIFTLLYFVIGWFNAHNVVKTEYQIDTDKITESVKVVLISDSHLGTTFDGEGFAREISKIQENNPDIVLITGDYVDGSSSYEDIITASAALGTLQTKYGVYYCFGNHDRNFYERNASFTEEQLVTELEKNNVIILQDEIVELPCGVTIIGREDASVKSRMPIARLMEQVDTSDFVIDMNHQPSDYDAEEAAGVDLVVSGHTHGGQLIPIRQVGVIVGATDKIYGREKRSNTEFVVTSGISDWALDFKTGCISEYVIINLNKAN